MTQFEKDLSELALSMVWEKPKYDYPQAVCIARSGVTVEFNDGNIFINTPENGTFEASLFVKRRFYKVILERSDFDDLELEVIRFDNGL